MILLMFFISILASRYPHFVVTLNRFQRSQQYRFSFTWWTSNKTYLLQTYPYVYVYRVGQVTIIGLNLSYISRKYDDCMHAWLGNCSAASEAKPVNAKIDLCAPQLHAIYISRRTWKRWQMWMKRLNLYRAQVNTRYMIMQNDKHLLGTGIGMTLCSLQYYTISREVNSAYKRYSTITIIMHASQTAHKNNYVQNGS